VESGSRVLREWTCEGSPNKVGADGSFPLQRDRIIRAYSKGGLFYFCSFGTEVFCLYEVFYVLFRHPMVTLQAHKTVKKINITYTGELK